MISISKRSSVSGRSTGIAAIPLSYSATMCVSPFPVDLAMPDSFTAATVSLFVRKRVRQVTSSRSPSSHSAMTLIWAISFVFWKRISFGSKWSCASFFPDWTGPKSDELGQGAPMAIHCSKSAISFSSSFRSGGICRSGFVCRTASMRRLFSAFPGTRAAIPDPPPSKASSRDLS